MPHSVVRDGLELLEKSDAEILDLVVHATQILGTAIKDYNHDHQSYANGVNSKLDQAFREQWVLKWLIRRFDTEVARLSSIQTKGLDTFLGHQQTWQLLLYLLKSIPDSALIELLIERKFLSCLDKSIQILLDPATGPEPVDLSFGANLASFPEASAADEEGKITKKRRLAQLKTVEEQDDTSRIPILTLALRVCRRCGGLLKTEGTYGDVPYRDNLTNWTSSPNDRASLFGKSISLIALLAANKSSRTSQPHPFEYLDDLLPLWTSRSGPSGGLHNSEDSRAFNRFCLGPVLQAIGATQISKDTRSTKRASTEPLMRLLAVYTVLPLRELFNRKHAQVWKTHLTDLMWPTIVPVYKDMIDDLCPDRARQEAGVLRIISPPWASHCHLIFEAAVRLVPKSDLRRRHSEQVWLDALMLTVAYIACPNLPRLVTSHTDPVEVLDSIHLAGASDHSGALEDMLQVACDHNVKCSTSVISYLAAAVSSWGRFGSPWKSISRLVLLNGRAFISDARTRNTSHAMDSLVQSIQHATVDNSDYNEIRDGIVLPLCRSFASSRNHKTFLEIWRENLKEALRVYTDQDDSSNTIPAIFVWLDEDVFDEVKVQTEQHAPQTLLPAYLKETLDDLNQLTTRIGSSLDTFALLAICEILLKASSNLESHIAKSSLLEMQDRLTAALKSRSDFRKQRWRLWSLLRTLHETFDISNLPEAVTEAGTLHVHQISAESPHSHDSVKSHRLRETLERFGFLAAVAGRGDAKLLSAFIQEVHNLQSLISVILSDSTDQPLTQRAWNGRESDLDSTYKLACACVGILNQHPQNYSLVPQFLPSLLQQLLAGKDHPSSLGHGKRGDNSIDQILWVALEIEQPISTTSNTLINAVVHQVSSEPSSVATMWKLVQNDSLDATSRSQRKTMSSSVLAALQDHLSTMSIPDLASCFNLLDRLSRHSPAFFAERWRLLLDVAGRLSEKGFDDSVEVQFVIAQCLRNVFSRIWQHALDHNSDTSTLKDVLGWWREGPPSSGSTEGIWLLWIRQTLLSLICDTGDSQMSDHISAMEIQITSRQIGQTVLLHLTRLREAQLKPNNIFSLATLLQFLNETSDHGDFAEDHFDLRKQLQSQTENLVDDRDAVIGYDGDHHSDVLNDVHRTISVLLGFEPVKDSLGSRLAATTWKDLGLEVNSNNGTVDQIAAEADMFVHNMPATAQEELLAIASDPQRRGELKGYEPFLTTSVLLRVSNTDLETKTNLSVYLADIASLKNVAGTSDLRILLLCLQNSKVALDLFVAFVNQSRIDSLLSSLCCLMSATSSVSTSFTEIQETRPEWVYDQVCAILGSLLSHYRRRLSDRHHLVLPVLQQLLRCLFFPGTRNLQPTRTPSQGSNPAALLKSLPWWLRDSATPLPSSSAQKLSRILSSICNPTVSAAKSSLKRNSSALNDETRHVKAIAGQHLQYLVMTYCRATLDGEIAPAVKEKLMPGMYSVLDSLSKDLMKAMNSGMDPSSRAIFKTLYDNWTRYGRWDKT